MKTAVISDVHGNFEALRAVLEEIERLDVDDLFSLGDAVGYGPEPQACVDLLRREASVNIMGNHDAAAVGMTDAAHFNVNARRAVEWTRRTLDEEAAAFLSALPYTRCREGILLAHASPGEPGAWHYVTTMEDAALCFDSFTEESCFVGHTHVPFIVSQRPDGSVEATESGGSVLEEGCRYLVNVGSVGQPRDRDSRASYALVDTGEGTVEIRRVPYDISKTQELMRRHELPPFLIERLESGR